MKLLFEASFEVCNLIGGIHTVIYSKIKSLKKYVDRHILLGPWLPNSDHEFIQAKSEEVPSEVQFVFDELSRKGISCTYGWWDHPERPEVILINPGKLFEEGHRNYLKTKYWDLFKVDSLNSRWDFDEPLVYATAFGMFIEEFTSQNCSSSDKVVGHFHEWMTGFGGLYLKSRQMEGEEILVKTVFTTHATMLGRAMSGHDQDISKLSKSFDASVAAKKIGVIEKFTAELACATFCDEFTTVSKITQKEAKLFFKKSPKLAYNGMDLDNFSKSKDLIHSHVQSRKKIISVLENLFPGESFNDYSLAFTSGRPEFHNKGHDRIIDSLKQMQDKNVKLACFFLVPWNHYGFKNDFDFCTHYLDGEETQPIMTYSREVGITNEGKTKLIFYPCYLGSPDDELFNMDYYELTKGFDLGLFPSSYEPWGYTPMESLACGVPAVTSNLTGFGDFYSAKAHLGLEIIKKDATEVSMLSKILLKYSQLDEPKKLVLSLECLNTVSLCDWKKFVKSYIRVYGFNQ